MNQLSVRNRVLAAHHQNEPKSAKPKSHRAVARLGVQALICLGVAVAAGCAAVGDDDATTVAEGAGGDENVAETSAAITMPSGFGRYCSIRYPGGGWLLGALPSSTSQPCIQLLADNPGGTIERAGVWSTSGTNNVSARCDNGSFVSIYRGTGDDPINLAFNASEGHSGCVFNVSPASMPVFERPYRSLLAPLFGPDYGITHVNGFDFNPTDLPINVTTDFGQPGGVALHIDHLGREHSNSHSGHDWLMPTGTPILAAADGVVLGSRSRDVREFGCGLPGPNGTIQGSTFQNEIYVRHIVGSGTYAEEFITYYAHLSSRSVQTGETVTQGQKIGESGDTGCSSDPHLHFGVARLRNTSFARSVNVSLTPGGAGMSPTGLDIEPYGFSPPKGMDPLGWRLAGQNIGSFSIYLWKSGERPTNDNW